MDPLLCCYELYNQWQRRHNMQSTPTTLLFCLKSLGITLTLPRPPHFHARFATSQGLMSRRVFPAKIIIALTACLVNWLSTCRKHILFLEGKLMEYQISNSGSGFSFSVWFGIIVNTDWTNFWCFIACRLLFYTVQEDVQRYTLQEQARKSLPHKVWQEKVEWVIFWPIYTLNVGHFLVGVFQTSTGYPI